MLSSIEWTLNLSERKKKRISCLADTQLCNYTNCLRTHTQVFGKTVRGKQQDTVTHHSSKTATTRARAGGTSITGRAGGTSIRMNTSTLAHL